MKNVAVLVVHGIGWHDDGSDRGLIAKKITRLMDPPRSVELLKEALREALPDVPYVVELAHWGKTIEPIQKRFEERYANLRWDNARRVAISALGDAAQYEAAVYAKGEPTFPTHAAIHRVVAETLTKLAHECGPEAPLVVIGHSLGAHIASNHIYDEQARSSRGEPPRHGGESPLERTRTLAGIVSLGCNIPLFVMGTEAPKPIELGGATWLNFYDPDDVLGFPLVPLYFPEGQPPKGYDLRDRRVEVGGPIEGRTPLSHGYYWDDGEIVDEIAAMIRAAARSRHG